jgi:hypothetical protein
MPLNCQSPNWNGNKRNFQQDHHQH